MVKKLERLEIASFRILHSSAVLALKNKVNSVLKPGKMKRYDDFVQIHKNAMMGPDMLMPMPHGGPLFFPWHRVLLRQFELALQAAAGSSSIALPYWDWELSWKESVDGSSGNAGLLREFGNDPTAYLPTQPQVASALTKIPYSPGTNSWERTCEGGMHNPVHVGSAETWEMPRLRTTRFSSCTIATSICFGKNAGSNIRQATRTCRPPAR